MRDLRESISLVEEAKEKAKKLKGSIIAVYRTTSIVIGKLEEVKIEKLWSTQVPFCRLRLKKVKKFDLEGRLIGESEEDFVYVNKKEFIFSLEELEKANKKVYKSFLNVL